MSIRLSALTFNSQRQSEMVEFYRALGADLQVRKVEKGGEVFKGNFGDCEISIFSIQKHESPQSPNLHIRIEVQKISSIVEKIKALAAGSILMDLAEIQDCLTAIVQDPDGHSIELVQPA